MAKTNHTPQSIVELAQSKGFIFDWYQKPMEKRKNSLWYSGPIAKIVDAQSNTTHKLRVDGEIWAKYYEDLTPGANETVYVRNKTGGENFYIELEGYLPNDDALYAAINAFDDEPHLVPYMDLQEGNNFNVDLYLENVTNQSGTYGVAEENVTLDTDTIYDAALELITIAESERAFKFKNKFEAYADTAIHALIHITAQQVKNLIDENKNEDGSQNNVVDFDAMVQYYENAQNQNFNEFEESTLYEFIDDLYAEIGYSDDESAPAKLLALGIESTSEFIDFVIIYADKLKQTFTKLNK